MGDILKASIYMCLIRHFRFWLYLCFLLTCTLFFSWLFTSATKRANKRNRLDSDAQVLRSDIPIELQNYCQFLELPLSGDEAELPQAELRLRGISVVTRHGDRSPLLPGNETPLRHCPVLGSETKQNFVKLRKLVGSRKFIDYLSVDRKFTSMAEFPLDDNCRPGMLTIEGCMQMSKLGEFLRNKYQTWNFFDDCNDSSVCNITMWSSIYPRTYQSAVAFVYGLFLKDNPDKSLLPTLNLFASPTTHFCRQKWCKCGTKIGYWKKVFEDEKRQFFEQEATTRFHRLFKKITHEIIELPEIKDPLALFDILMGRHVCRRVPLPCSSGSSKESCVNYMDVLELYHFIQHRANRLGSSPTFKRLSVSEAAPIYSELAAISKLLKENEKFSFFRYFSGHDITVRPLLYVLNQFDGRVPHYGARIVFEFYQRRHGSKEVLVRVLYDGRDLTSKLSFCKRLVQITHYQLCKLSDFTRFAEDELYGIAQAASLENLC